jgi:hypothetical protein
MTTCKGIYTYKSSNTTTTAATVTLTANAKHEPPPRSERRPVLLWWLRSRSNREGGKDGEPYDRAEANNEEIRTHRDRGVTKVTITTSIKPRILWRIAQRAMAQKWKKEKERNTKKGKKELEKRQYVTQKYIQA